MRPLNCDGTLCRGYETLKKKKTKKKKKRITPTSIQETRKEGETEEEMGGRCPAIKTAATLRQRVLRLPLMGIKKKSEKIKKQSSRTEIEM